MSTRSLAGVLTGFALTIAACQPAAAVEFDDPVSFALTDSWSCADLGVPGTAGALLFSLDGAQLYVVGDAGTALSAMYAVPVQRDPATDEVVDLGPGATQWFAGDASRPGLDAGAAFGPEDTLFYTYFDANELGQRPLQGQGEEGLFALGVYGIPTAVSGLAFSPLLADAGSGFGMLQLSVGGTAEIYQLTINPLCDGHYVPLAAERFAAVPDAGLRGIAYVPRGQHARQLLIADEVGGAIDLVAIDPVSGLAVDAQTSTGVMGTEDPLMTPFARDLVPAGLTFDPLTDELFVSTTDGAIHRIAGEGLVNHAPQAIHDEITASWEDWPVFDLEGFDPDGDPLVFEVTAEPEFGALVGEPPTLEYQFEWGFVGEDSLQFTASDGDLTSEPGTITFTIFQVDDDDDHHCTDDDVSDDDTTDPNAIWWDDDEDEGGCSCSVTVGRARGVLPTLLLLALALARSCRRRD